MRLDEVAKLPSGLDVYKVLQFLQKELPDLKHAYASVPFKVWTRGDGYRYKDPAYIEFGSESDCTKAWKFLTSLTHQEVTVLGPMGSEKNDGILVGSYVFIERTRRINVYSKQTIMRSPIIHFGKNGDSKLMWMINHLVQSGKPLAVKLRSGKVDVQGEVTAVDDRHLTFKDGSSFRLPNEADILYTIKTVDGVPTVVKK